MPMPGRGGSPAIASPVRGIKGSMLGESIVTTSRLGHARKETLSVKAIAGTHFGVNSALTCEWKQIKNRV